jgi:hypothetical protein
VCASGLFISGSGFGVIDSTSIASVCDRTSNRFLEINSFLCLMVFWVEELGSEELERFLFSAYCIQPSLLGLFELFCVDERLALELFVDMFRRASYIIILLFLLLLLIF